MFQFGMAYRHKSGEIEGFKGMGFTAESARKDALNQIRRKLDTMQNPADREFEPVRAIERGENLSEEEQETCRRDWATNVRY